MRPETIVCLHYGRTTSGQVEWKHVFRRILRHSIRLGFSRLAAVFKKAVGLTIAVASAKAYKDEGSSVQQKQDPILKKIMPICGS